MRARRFHIETLGCPKNAVDSDKIVGSLFADGLERADSIADADLVVVNTCAFIEAARQESIDTVLALADAKAVDARLVVTGCLAERYGDELADALPEADAVVGFASEGAIAQVTMLATKPLARKPTGVTDLLDLPRPAPSAPWAYVKVAEGCDRACAFCAIPSFRGKQRSRSLDAIEAEVRALLNGGAREIVLVAQDLAWYGRDVGEVGALSELLTRLDALAGDGLARQRLLYLYPSEVRAPLLDRMLELPTVAPYFDLSLQHASGPLLRRMKRWGSGDRFRTMIDGIRTRRPDAAFRSSFICGFPGETEADHDELLAFLSDAQLDWAGFFAFSREEGTAAADLDGEVPAPVVTEWLRECGEVQEQITTAKRLALVGCEIEVLVDGFDDDVAFGRSYRETPEIDGVVRLDGDAKPGDLVRARVTDVEGPDLDAVVT
ncbi:MAG: ribosomal protein methylthiotransferase [Actinomycetota bacterium]|nr:ribosomal protein methylthiotransferase [Actinomycetota bacterium]